MSYCKIILKGNLTRDPELRATQSGKTMCRFAVAVNDGRGDEKKVAFYNVVAWEKRAETVNKWLKKGSAVLIEGRPSLNVYEDREGKTRASIDVMMTDFDFCGGKQGDADAGQTRAAAPRNDAGFAPKGAPDAFDRAIADEDIPF